MSAVEQWTRGEMLAVAGSLQVADGDVAVVGLGLPQMAALLAQRTHAPTARLLLEIGVFEPMPTEPAVGIADPRMWRGATAFSSTLEVLGVMVHGGRVSLGLLGALQVDQWGSFNTTEVEGTGGSRRRFRGSGGGNDISSNAGRIVIVMTHEARKFAEALTFLTSPGRRVAALTRADLGLPGEGPCAVVTDRAVIALTSDGAVLESVHPGEHPDTVAADTPIPLAVPCGGPKETPAPTASQLAIIRNCLDPKGWYTS
jgi:glutaconate CoA-transferase, subunit B